MGGCFVKLAFSLSVSGCVGCASEAVRERWVGELLRTAHDYRFTVQSEISG